MRIQSLLLITGNPGKAQEFQELLQLPGLKVGHQALPLTEIQSAQLSEVARAKTQVALLHPERQAGWDAVLTDDTGLGLAALNGLPGPLIKQFLEALGPAGLYDLTRHRGPGATASCLLSLGLTQGHEIHQFLGEVQGQLVPPRGGQGFGWDAIFLPQGKSQTYAELSLSEKNQISHRALAVAKLRAWLLEG